MQSLKDVLSESSRSPVQPFCTSCVRIRKKLRMQSNLELLWKIYKKSEWTYACASLSWVLVCVTRDHSSLDASNICRRFLSTCGRSSFPSTAADNCSADLSNSLKPESAVSRVVSVDNISAWPVSPIFLTWRSMQR